MSEQELYMMGEERAKDEIGAQNMMKKHQTLEHVVEDYADVVRQLGEKSRNLIDQDHPERYSIYWLTYMYFMFNRGCNIHPLVLSNIIDLFEEKR